MMVENRAILCASAAVFWIYAITASSFVKTSLNGELFARAEAAALVSITKKPTLTKQSQMLWDHAIARIAVGDTKSAEQAFMDLLTYTPDFFPALDTPPKIMLPFQRARRQFLSLTRERELFKAKITKETMKNGQIHLILDADDKLLNRVSEIVVHIRTAQQAVFRSVSLKAPFEGQGALSLHIPYNALATDHLEYYVDFVGNFGEPFHAIGSASWPRSIVAEATEKITPPADGPPSNLTHLKAGWPIVIGATIAVVGALTFGLLKLHH